jgi:hypothetical protein
MVSDAAIPAGAGTNGKACAWYATNDAIEPHIKSDAVFTMIVPFLIQNVVADDAVRAMQSQSQRSSSASWTRAKMNP